MAHAPSYASRSVFRNASCCSRRTCSALTSLRSSPSSISARIERSSSARASKPGKANAPLCLAFLGNWSVERKHVRCTIEALYEGEAKYAVAVCLANHDSNGNPVRQAVHKRAVVVLPRVSSAVGRVIEYPGSICKIDGSAIVVGSPSVGMDGEGVPSPSFIGDKRRARYVDPSVTAQGNGGFEGDSSCDGEGAGLFPRCFC